MKITIRVPEKVVAAAKAREAAVDVFVEELVARGMDVIRPRSMGRLIGGPLPGMASPMERIRMLGANQGGRLGR
jgi:hypothetical protein